jgi:hypothetical protein
MKNVTIMMAVAVSLMAAGSHSALAHGRGDTPSMTPLVSDVPLAAPDRQPSSASVFAADNRQMSGSNYFYAPGAGPRCEIRMKRVQGRIYQTCE